MADEGRRCEGARPARIVRSHGGMGPVTPEPALSSATIAALFAVAAIFLLAVFGLLLGRLARDTREIRTLTCPEDQRRALVLIRSSKFPAGRAIAECSRWHDRRLPCGERCLGVAPAHVGPWYTSMNRNAASGGTPMFAARSVRTQIRTGPRARRAAASADSTSLSVVAAKPSHPSPSATRSQRTVPISVPKVRP
jgi:hypothetical protein